MKVLLINGSRRDEGCTRSGLSIAAKSLEEEGIETEILNVGSRIYRGELSQTVKEAAEKVKTADAFIVGTPVYYASPSGEIISFLDRLFGVCGDDLRFKPASAISSCRRAGNTASLDVIYKYFSINEMPIVSSNYWNEIHGSKPEDVLKDIEGQQIMSVLGKNMAWILKSIEAGKKTGIKQPSKTDKIYTNFIK